MLDHVRKGAGTNNPGISIRLRDAPKARRQGENTTPESATNESTQTWTIGWHYLSNASCLIRPHLLYALCIVSRIAGSCYTIRQG